MEDQSAFALMLPPPLAVPAHLAADIGLLMLVSFDKRLRTACAKHAGKPVATIHKAFCAVQGDFDAYAPGLRGRLNKIGVTHGVMHHLEVEYLDRVVQELEGALQQAAASRMTPQPAT